MSLFGSRATPTEVFYVVQSTGARGRREHRLASVLYEMRPDAHTELARLSAAHPGALPYTFRAYIGRSHEAIARRCRGFRFCPGGAAHPRRVCMSGWKNLWLLRPWDLAWNSARSAFLKSASASAPSSG